MSRIFAIRILIIIEICSRIDDAAAVSLAKFQSRPRSRITTCFAAEKDDFATKNGMSLKKKTLTFPSELVPREEVSEDLTPIDLSADDISTLNSLTSLDRMSKISTKNEVAIWSSVSETASASIILFLGSFAVSYLIGDLLLKFEWLQDWRYFWPLIGGLFVADPIMRVLNGKSDNNYPLMLPFGLSKNRGIEILSIVGGAFTLIGGAYDAFMPVWQTGPNVFTIAGIGQDGAIMLLLVTAISIVQETWEMQASEVAQPSSGSSQSLLQTLLLAELYKLGESSADEILSAVESVANSIG
ncbi:MAG: hypothetical protein SGBAC_005688 [Bacillariaceae sp.]